jgi:hypothetical protein
MLLCGLESNNNRLLRLLSTIVVVSILSLVLFTDGPKGVGVDANSVGFSGFS